MFVHKKFDVEIIRKLDKGALSWPKPGEACLDTGLGGNRSYLDLRKMGWVEARRILQLEEQLISRIEAAVDWSAEYDLIEEELCDDPGDVYGLDIGVASTVAGLSAGRCVPFSSCNAGAFGGGHLESYPLVAFFARSGAVGLLLECAEKAACGLENTGGALIVYSDEISKMVGFAKEMIARSSEFQGLRLRPKGNRKKRKTIANPQLPLFQSSR